MYPRPQIHGRIQGQRLIFHFNSLATQSQPCERRQGALRVPNEMIKRWKTSASISSTTQRPLNRLGNLVMFAKDTTPQLANQTSCNTRGPLRSKTRRKGGKEEEEINRANLLISSLSIAVDLAAKHPEEGSNAETSVYLYRHFSVL